MDFYQHYKKKVKDISITQIDENNNSDWKDYDLNVDGLPIDVKNSRQSWKSPDRYTEHCIPRFKQSREHRDVKIAGVFFPLPMAMYITGFHRICRRYYNPISWTNNLERFTGVEKRI